MYSYVKYGIKMRKNFIGILFFLCHPDRREGSLLKKEMFHYRST